MGVIVQVGVDIGQRINPTALVVANLEWREGTWHYVIRHVERLPLQTSYPAVVSRLDTVRVALTRHGCVSTFWLDATGVGQPVIDLLQEVGFRTGKRANLIPVFFTGSDKAVLLKTGELRLGKALLVSRLQVLLQARRIHLPRTDEARALVEELSNYEIKVTDAGRAQFGVFRTGMYDDLVVALGLAVWNEPGRTTFGNGVVPRAIAGASRLRASENWILTHLLAGVL